METDYKLELLIQKKKLIVFGIYMMSGANGINAALVESEPKIKDFFWLLSLRSS